MRPKARPGQRCACVRHSATYAHPWSLFGSRSENSRARLARGPRTPARDCASRASLDALWREPRELLRLPARSCAGSARRGRPRHAPGGATPRSCAVPCARPGPRPPNSGRRTLRSGRSTCLVAAHLDPAAGTPQGWAPSKTGRRTAFDLVVNVRAAVVLTCQHNKN
jgi:hypothetical protein